ncbi:MAG: Fe-S cluster assembly ATPase SufC [Candidatus Aenigmarchaeota archaeon]|nr:Fe-S cluster assembly ATPase SufC [Candidatus Aenigmarchaeota archaeon]
MPNLVVKDLHASVDGTPILKGINLEVKEGEVNTIMGPNGSGKSTLAYILMGHPKYTIDKGQILIDGEDIAGLPADERAKRGLFLSFQYPQEISGVTVSNFLRTALSSVKNEKISVMDFKKLMDEKLDMLKMDHAFGRRYLNEGFSGGEKKKAEILQLAVIQPKIAILDETDSGTDVDALKIISNGINVVAKSQKMGILLITHYDRILQYIKTDHVHVLVDGKIVKSGGPELAKQVESEGYAPLRQ